VSVLSELIGVDFSGPAPCKPPRKERYAFDARVLFAGLVGALPSLVGILENIYTPQPPPPPPRRPCGCNGAKGPAEMAELLRLASIGRAVAAEQVAAKEGGA